ncbi:MAG: LysE family translocator [Alphaproteobacteria bacterium]|nr:LysE family translocator [Alphaproteobacteria bacterium]
MISPAALLGFISVSFVMEATPGPNMGYLALLSAADGRRAGMSAVAGVALGLFLMGMAAAFGLAVAVTQSPILYHVLLWAGVGYMLWLAVEAWRGEKGGTDDIAGSPLKFFRRGLITNLLNPKAFVFYVTVMPRFAGDVASISMTMMLVAVYVAVATLVHTGIVMLAGTAQPFLATPQRIMIVRRVFAIMLAGIAIWMAWATI